MDFEGLKEIQKWQTLHSRSKPPCLNTSAARVNWNDLHDDIEKLATTFSLCNTFLDNSNKQQQERQSKMNPFRQIEKRCDIDVRMQKMKSNLNFRVLITVSMRQKTLHLSFLTMTIFLTQPFII